MLFKISVMRYRHSGPCDPYLVDTGEVVEAESSAHVPVVYASRNGFVGHAVLRLSDTDFMLGDSRYTVSPA